MVFSSFIRKVSNSTRRVWRHTVPFLRDQLPCMIYVCIFFHAFSSLFICKVWNVPSWWDLFSCTMFEAFFTLLLSSSLLLKSFQKHRHLTISWISLSWISQTIPLYLRKTTINLNWFNISSLYDLPHILWAKNSFHLNTQFLQLLLLSTGTWNGRTILLLATFLETILYYWWLANFLVWDKF